MSSIQRGSLEIITAQILISYFLKLVWSFLKYFSPEFSHYKKKLHFYRRPNSSFFHKKFFSKIFFSVVKTTVDTRSKKKIKWLKVFSSLEFSGKPKNSIFINNHRRDYFRYKLRSRKSMLSCSSTISYRIFRKIF